MRSGPTTTFERPRERPIGSVAASSGQRRPTAVTPFASPPIGSSVTRSPTLAPEGQAPPPADRAHDGRARDRPQLDPGEVRIGQQEEIRQLVVEPIAADRAEQVHLAGTVIDRRPKGELRVRGVLVHGMAIDARPRRLQPLDECGRGRVEVADEPIGPPSEPVERRGAAVGGNHRVGAVQPGLVARRQCTGGDDHDPHRSSIAPIRENDERRASFGRVDRSEARRGGLHRLPSPA